ncbi:MAG: hypothetical protein K6U74_05940 [Firmicutes bacterium]|nr:hypothetical protein [Bacillota bacterium]
MIIDLQEKIRERLKRAIPSQAFSMEKTENNPDARRLVQEALILAKAGNFSGAVDTAFTAGYITACEEVLQALREAQEKLLARQKEMVRDELRRQLAEQYPDIYRELYGKKGGEGK